MIKLSNRYMTKVNRMEFRKAQSGKLYTVIYAKCKNIDTGVETEQSILLDECGRPIEIPSAIPSDVIDSMELVKMHMYYKENE